MLLPVSPEAENTPSDMQIVRFVDEANEFHFRERHEGEILVSGSLGADTVSPGIDKVRRSSFAASSSRPRPSADSTEGMAA